MKFYTKIITCFVVGLLCSCLIFLSLLPTIISTEWGKNQLLSFLNHRIPGSVELKSINLSWLSPQTFQEIKLFDPQGVMVGEIHSVQMTPSLLEIGLKGWLQGTISIDNLNAVLTEKENGITNLHEALGESYFSSEGFHRSNPSLQTLTVVLSKVSAKLHMPSTNEPMSFLAQGETQQGDISGRFDITAILQGNNPKTLRPKDLSIRIDHFPIAIADHFLSIQHPHLTGILRAALGQTLDLSARQLRNADSNEIFFDATSSHLKANISGNVASEALIVSPSSKIFLKITPELLQKIGHAPVNIGKEAWASFAFDQTTISLNNIEKSFLDTIITVDSLSFDEFEIQKANVSLKGPLNALKGNLNGEVNLKSQQTLLQFVGKHLHVTADALFQNKNGIWTLDPIFADIQSDKGNALISAAINEKGEFLLKDSAQIHYIVDPALVANVSGNKDLLSEKVKAVLFIEPFIDPIELNNINFSQMKLRGKIVLPNLTLNGGHEIKNLSIPWSLDGTGNEMELQLLGEEKQKIKANIHLVHCFDSQGKIDFDHLLSHIDLEMHQWPVATLNSFFGQKLEVLLGTTIDLAANAQLSSITHPVGTCTFNLSGNELSLSGALNVMKDTISLQESIPIKIKTLLTAEKLHILRGFLNPQMIQDSLTLLEPTQVNATIHSFSMPYDKPFNESALAINANLSLSHLKIGNNNQQGFYLDDVHMHVEGQNLLESLKFLVKGMEMSTSTPNPFTVNGTLTHFLTPTGSLNPDLSVNFEAKSQNFPASIFCQTLCVNPSFRNKMEVLLGKTIDTDIQVKMHRRNGPIRAELSGSNGWVLFDGQMNDGILTLNSPFQVEITVTPQFGESILEDVLPILSGVISSESPVKIEIDPQGFAIPVNSLELENIKIGKTTIDLGKMTFSNKGQLGTIFELLKPSNQEKLSVWFTPLYLQMLDGKVKVSRMDMLVLNRYPMAIWGKVNLIKDDVDMRIGITGMALQQALNINGLDNNYMMQLPLTGTLGDTSIDKAKATARISALVAHNQGNAQGMLIGTVLGIAGGNFSEEKPPHPTTNPLPWETQTKSKKLNKKSDKRKTSFSDLLEEAASSVIKDLLK